MRSSRISKRRWQETGPTSTSAIVPANADGAAMPEELKWEQFVEKLKDMHSFWFTPTGSHIVYRLTQADMLACVKMVRGDTNQIWLSAEPKSEHVRATEG